MMNSQMMTESQSHAQILPKRHAHRLLAGLSHFIQRIPGMSEIAVEMVHVLGHAIVDAEFGRRELGERLCGRGRRGRRS